jgi:hypothetical protein
MSASEAQQKRPEATAPGLMSGLTSGLVGRMRIALGGRDHRAEVAGYRLALKDAGPSQVGVIVDRLLELAETEANIEALTLVASVFDRIEASKRDRALVTGHGLWGKACGAAAIDVDPDARLSAATLIGRICESETFGPLREMLGDQDERVAERAGASLLAIAERAADAPALDGETLGAIERMVIRSVGNFERHRRREAMGALLAICSSPAAIRAAGPELRGWLADREHPAHMILRGMLRRGDGLTSRESAWLWLGCGEHRAGCVERLSAPCDASGHERVLINGHLLHNPARRAALAGAAERDRKRRTSGLTIDPETVDKLAPRAQANVAAWIECVERGRAGESLETMLTAPSDLARFNTLREIARAGGSDLALDFCFDSNPRLARSAALAVGTPSPRTALGVERVRRTLHGLEFASTGATRETAAALADAVDPMAGHGAGLATAWRMLRANRAGMAATLQAQVRSGSGAGRIRAIQLATRLGLSAELELELLSIIALSTHATGHIASEDRRDILHAAAAAVTALADLPSPAAQHAVHKCLRHPDDRVRANALDALAHVARRGGSIGEDEQTLAAAVIEFKDDPHHRVRAAAARAKLLGIARARTGANETPVIQTLLPLLTDDRPMHRVSGLWLAERTAGLASGSGSIETGSNVSAAIAAMVRNDPSPEVRIRARHTAAHLLANMRHASAEPSTAAA